MPVVLEVLSGLDQGKRFPLAGELLHIGTGRDNGIVLSDPALGEFHASLSVQGNQISLYANETQEITVGDARLPRQQWVPVSIDTSIQLGGSTEIRFVTVQDETTPPAAPSSPERKKPARKESKRQVAKLITNRGTEATVQLGSDGRYPELALASVAAPTRSDSKPKESNPVLLFTVLAASCLTSVGLMLADFDTAPISSTENRVFARSELASFYGTDSSALEPYQKLLRQAAVKYSQGDYDSERALLRQVLSLLKAVDAKDPENLNGLTGKQTGKGKASDEKLRRLLETVLTH
jgi:hypothetical protein